MLLLALDTATSAITVALHDGTDVLAEATVVDPKAHAEHLAPLVRAVLADAGAVAADLTDVACGLGPGPFTGLRVGVVTGRTLALVTGARLLGLCSLDALAYQAWRTRTVEYGDLLVATDARRKEVYWATYRLPADPERACEWPRRTRDLMVTRPADLPPDATGLPVVGRGPDLYPSAFHQTGPPGPLDVSAAFLADLVVRRLAAGDPVDEHEPYYLRRPDAVPSATVKSALG